MRRICHTEVEWHRQLQLFIQHQLSWPITTVHVAPAIHSEQNSYPRDPQNALEQVHNLLSYRCDVDVFHAARNSDDDDG